VERHQEGGFYYQIEVYGVNSGFVEYFAGLLAIPAKRRIY